MSSHPRRTASFLSLGLLALLAPLVLLATPAQAHGGRHAQPHWQPVPVATTQGFRGLDAVSRRVAWVGGSAGSVFTTRDGGRTWHDVSPSDSTGLLFRDVQAFDADHVAVLAIGPGDASRVYRTDDGGRSWTRTFTNEDPNAFYDCMTFFDRRNGIALSDPVDGRFRILRTTDGGRSWAVQDPAGMPAALPGEAAFAASGTCLTSFGERHAWFGTGGGDAARVFRSSDAGRTWRVSATPLPSTPAGGVDSLAFRDARHGIALGADFSDPPVPTGIARTSDGGRTWQTVPTASTDTREGSAWVRSADRTGIVVGGVAGHDGSELTRDGGRTWRALPPTGTDPLTRARYDAVECARDGGCWASGPNGAVARLVGLDRAGPSWPAGPAGPGASGRSAARGKPTLLIRR